MLQLLRIAGDSYLWFATTNFEYSSKGLKQYSMAIIVFSKKIHLQKGVTSTTNYDFK